MGNVTGKLDPVLFQEDDGVETTTSTMQSDCERDCARFYKTYATHSEEIKHQLKQNFVVDSETEEPLLYKQKTIDYLLKGLKTGLSSAYSDLASSRPWILYWSVHGLSLLGYNFDEDNDLVSKCLKTLKICQNKSGGYAGDFLELSHTAPTYAAVLSVATIGTVEAYNVIDRPALYAWLLEMKDKELKAFHVQKDGEVDTRGLYTVLAVASITNMLTPELIDGVAEFVGRCQTGEGGVGGEPGNEAHGGYAFCALAALHILNRFDTVDLDAFLHWIVSRQMRAEGGFQGRTNKLVDSCYSFWQGAIPALLHLIPGYDATNPLKMDIDEIDTVEVELNSGPCEIVNVSQSTFYDKMGSLLNDQLRLQQYIIVCCQFIEGGLRDKPSKHRDQYHTCYSLSGLSVSQHYGLPKGLPNEYFPLVWGDKKNLLERTDPVYNVEVTKLKKAMAHFRQDRFASSHQELLEQFQSRKQI